VEYQQFTGLPSRDRPFLPAPVPCATFQSKNQLLGIFGYLPDWLSHLAPIYSKACEVHEDITMYKHVAELIRTAAAKSAKLELIKHLLNENKQRHGNLFLRFLNKRVCFYATNIDN